MAKHLHPSHVYAVRQEYNPFQKKWFPIVFSWDWSASRCWLDCLCTETGSSFYHIELNDYGKTSAGTDKCDPDDVKRIVAQFKSEFVVNADRLTEVKKLGAYRP